MQTISNRRSRVLQIAAALLPLVAFAASARADIFQWEYINPADPSQGKRQSTTLAPGGAGVDTVPGADLSKRNLTMAYLIGANLMGANAYAANLTNADLSQANLTNAHLFYATLTDADFTGAVVFRASFYAENSGLTTSQLYSTAGYQAHDLTEIRLGGDMSGWNFAGQNLTNAYLFGATLTGASFAQTNLTTVDLGFAGLTDADLSSATLIDADLTGAALTDADFTGAEIRGALFHKYRVEFADTGTGLTLTQLYSTASYLAHDLSGIGLAGSALAGGNFAGQNLSGASFTAPHRVVTDLTGANLSAANLTNVAFGAADLTGADFTGADARGALLNPTDAITANLILPDGHIDGLDLDAGSLLVVRDDDVGSLYYPDAPPMSITVDQHFAMGPGGALRMVFEADAWDSTISFARGIQVSLGGTLELTFADDVNLASQVGRTLDLFDWTGVTPTGMFDVTSDYSWDTTRLYTTGQVTLVSIPEPSALALVAISSLAGLFCIRRRWARAVSNAGALRRGRRKRIQHAQALALGQRTDHFVGTSKRHRKSLRAQIDSDRKLQSVKRPQPVSPRVPAEQFIGQLEMTNRHPRHSNYPVSNIAMNVDEISGHLVFAAFGNYVVGPRARNSGEFGANFFQRHVRLGFLVGHDVRLGVEPGLSAGFHEEAYPLALRQRYGCERPKDALLVDRFDELLHASIIARGSIPSNLCCARGIA
jgi:uncharacterized protein YjbI with pentapeptide repeats